MSLNLYLSRKAMLLIYLRGSLPAIATLLLALPPGMSLSAQVTSREIDATKWSPERAVEVQRSRQMRDVQQLERNGEQQRAQEIRQQQITREMGIGVIPHASGPREDLSAPQVDPTVLEIQRLALEKSMKEGIPLSQALQELLPSPQADNVRLVLKTPLAGPVTGGGRVMAYTAETKAYLGGSVISGDGTILLPVDIGEVVDLVVYPYPPFAIQLARNVTVVADADVMLEDAIQVPVSLADDQGSAMPAVGAQIWATLLSYPYNPRGRAGYITGSGTAYLAPSESYEIYVEPDLPFLVNEPQPATEGQSLAIRLQRGALIDFVFNDPDNLGNVDDCKVYGYLILYFSQNEWAYRRRVSVPRLNWVNGDVAGVTFAVPPGIAVDYSVNFQTDAENCLLQDIEQRFAWFSDDQSVAFDLKARPQPNVILRTPGGETLPWTNGVFYTDDRSEGGRYFNFGQEIPALQAGKTYFAHIESNELTSTAVRQFVAQSGVFDVVIEAERLVTVLGKVSIAGSSYVPALIEFYRNGELVEAFEHVGSDLTMEVPAGDYELRVSGMTSEFWDPIGARNYQVLLKPMVVQRSVTGAEGERLDFLFDVPTRGVDFDVPNKEMPVQVFAYDADRLTNSARMNPDSAGILTDFEQLDLELIGPGFDDTRMVMTPGEPHSSFDLAARQGAVGRLQGRVLDADGKSLANVQVSVHGQDGIWFWGSTATAVDGSFDIPKVKNALVVLSAPAAGNSLMSFHTVQNPGVNEVKGVKLRNLPFNTVQNNGSNPQLLYGTGSRGYQVAFISEGYVEQQETFTDQNGNQVWDGLLYIDYNSDGLWQNNEPVKEYGEASHDWNANGTDISAKNEPFNDLNGDGYPNIDDFSVYVQNAKDYVRALLGTPAIADNIDFDAWLVWEASPQSGLDVYDENDDQIMDWNTRFGGGFHLPRHVLEIDYVAVNEILSSVVPNRDLTVAMINMPVRTGRPNAFVIARGGVGNTSPNNMIAGHEFGHNPGGLADEYNEFNGTSHASFGGGFFHLSHHKQTDLIPWYPMVTGRTDLPVSAPNSPGNGIYAGGQYNAGGVVRSTSNSRMRHNSPLYNDASMRVFIHSLCMRSLTEEDFRGAIVQPPGSDVLMRDGFETRRGVLELCP